MCGGSPDVDTSYQKKMREDAERARAEEEARKARIKDGSARIDQNFGQFDDNFFNGYRDTYLDFYQPEIDKKFGDARDQLTYALARAGTLNSSIAGTKQADLNTAYDTQRALTLSEANSATDQLKGSVAGEKSNLISLLNATGDADRAANESLSRSQQLFQRQPAYNPLGDIFVGAASGIGNYYAGQQQRQAYDTYFGGRSPSSGSSRVVGG